MSEKFVVRVATSFVCRIARGEFVLGELTSAMRFNRSEAQSIADTVRWKFPNNEVVAAHEERPYLDAEDEDESETSEEFVVAIGRLYLTQIRVGRILSAFSLERAKRFNHWGAQNAADVVRQTWKKARVHVAHESRPFIPVIAQATFPDDADDD